MDWKKNYCIIDSKKQQKNKHSQNLFFENIIKIDKSLSILIKKEKKGKTAKIRNEIRNTSPELIEININDKGMQ